MDEPAIGLVRFVRPTCVGEDPGQDEVCQEVFTVGLPGPLRELLGRVKLAAHQMDLGAASQKICVLRRAGQGQVDRLGRLFP